MKFLTGWLVLGSFFGVPNASAARAWQVGQILDEQTSTTYLGSLHTRSVDASAMATRIGNTVTAQGRASSIGFNIPLYRTDQVVVIDTAQYRYIVSRRVWRERAALTVNGSVEFAVEGSHAYILDDANRQFKTELFRAVLKLPEEVKPTFQSPFTGTVRGSGWRSWVSVSGPDRFAVRVEGSHIYAEQILGATAWLKLDVSQSANMYVGLVHFGFTDSRGRSCSFDKPAELTRVDDSRIEGAMVVFPSGASITTADCASRSRTEIRRFSWIPE